MKRIFFCIILIFLFNGCSYDYLEVNFVSQPIPSEISEQIEKQLKARRPSNELTQDNTLRVALYGFDMKKGDMGFAVTDVSENSLASYAGLSVGDTVTKVNDTSLKGVKDNGLQEILDLLHPSTSVTLLTLRNEQKRRVTFLPPFEYDWNNDGIYEQLSYFATDSPYTSQFVIQHLSLAQPETFFDFISKTSFISEIEKYTPEFFTRESIVDFNSDEQGELILTLKHENKTSEKRLILEWNDKSFEPVRVSAAGGEETFAVFDVYNSKRGSKHFDWVDIDEQLPPEFVSWEEERAAKPNTSQSTVFNTHPDVIVTAWVYQWSSGKYRYNKILSEQFARGKQLVLNSATVSQE